MNGGVKQMTRAMNKILSWRLNESDGAWVREQEEEIVNDMESVSE